MASLDKKNGSFIVLVTIEGKQKKIYTGLKEERAADRLKDKIQALADARKNGLTDIEAGLADWVKKLETGNSKVYEKLVSLGLLEQKARPVTVGEICRDYVKRAEKRKDRTQVKYEKTVARLCEYFGENKPVAEITPDDAYKFDEWFRTAPLNKRGKKAKPYEENTANREMRNVKSVFAYARKLGRIPLDPFASVQSGACGDTENKTYIKAEIVYDVIQAETTPLKWKVILALGRFAGCRGASDLCLLTWNDVIFSDDGKQGKITLRGKTKPGTIPLAPVLEDLLQKWYLETTLRGIDSQKVFPEVDENSNVSEMTKKSILKAGKDLWKNPWYSLRDSFCNDVLRYVKDVKTYEFYCRHSIKTALQYYQKVTEHRESEGAENLKESPLWIDFGSVKADFAADGLQKSAGNPVNFSTLDDMIRGIKKGIIRGLNGGLQGGLFNALDLQKIKEEIIRTLVNTTLDDIQYPQKNLLAIPCKKGLYSQGGDMENP